MLNFLCSILSIFVGVIDSSYSISDIFLTIMLNRFESYEIFLKFKLEAGLIFTFTFLAL